MPPYSLLHGRDSSLQAPARVTALGADCTRASSSARPRLQQRDGRKRALVVDDEESIRDLTAAWLAEEGFLVATARNGADALRQVRDFNPHVIVLDLMMPVMDGWAFAEACHRLTGPVGIPIVLISAGQSLAQAASQLCQFGVRASIAKPFDLEVLADTANALAERRDAVTAVAS